MKNWVLHIIFFVFSFSFCLESLSSIGFPHVSDISLADSNEEQPENECEEKYGYIKEASLLSAHDFDICFTNHQVYSSLSHHSLSKPYLGLALRPPQSF